MDVEEELSKLSEGRASSLEIVVESVLPGREQVVRVEAGSEGGFMARSLISDEVGEGVRQDIATWNQRYPLVCFRLADGRLHASLELPQEASTETKAELVRYLARLADRLEYEVRKGRDSF
jgi:hypothetical protein